ncbi:MAG: restriction endonuclease subunit M, partial [Elusimicrobia bacterium CG_4_10_14_0_8_um_filter_37_32]
GTLGRAALNLNRHFFLTEKELKYIDRIKEELNKSRNLFSLKDSQSGFVDLENFIKSFKGTI